MKYVPDIFGALVLCFYECGTGEFPYIANEGPVKSYLDGVCQCFSLLFTSRQQAFRASDGYATTVTYHAVIFKFKLSIR